jgi:hypothetical protein
MSRSANESEKRKKKAEEDDSSEDIELMPRVDDDGDSAVELLPLTGCNAVGFVGYVGVLLVKLAALLLLVVLVILCNMYLLLKPLSNRINAATHNTSTGCPFTGPCQQPVVCFDDSSRFDWICFAVGLGVTAGEFVAGLFIGLVVHGLWIRYSRLQQQQRRHVEKTE